MSQKSAGPEILKMIELIAKLPGLGPRSARRAALHLLKRKDQLLLPLADALLANWFLVQAGIEVPEGVTTLLDGDVVHARPAPPSPAPEVLTHTCLVSSETRNSRSIAASSITPRWMGGGAQQHT